MLPVYFALEHFLLQDGSQVIDCVKNLTFDSTIRHNRDIVQHVVAAITGPSN